MSKVAVFAKLTAAEGKRDALVDVLRAQIDLVADEAGTEIYALHTADGDETSVWFYEVYTDKSSAELHSTSDAMKALGPKLAGLIAGRPEIIRCTPVKAKGL